MWVCLFLGWMQIATSGEEIQLGLSIEGYSWAISECLAIDRGALLISVTVIIKAHSKSPRAHPF